MMSRNYKRGFKRNLIFSHPQILALLKEIPLTDRPLHQDSRMRQISKISLRKEEPQVFSFSYSCYMILLMSAPSPTSTPNPHSYPGLHDDSQGGGCLGQLLLWLSPSVSYVLIYSYSCCISCFESLVCCSSPGGPLFPPCQSGRRTRCSGRSWTRPCLS